MSCGFDPILRICDTSMGTPSHHINYQFPSLHFYCIQVFVAHFFYLWANRVFLCHRHNRHFLQYIHQRMYHLSTALEVETPSDCGLLDRSTIFQISLYLSNWVSNEGDSLQNIHDNTSHLPVVPQSVDHNM